MFSPRVFTPLLGLTLVGCAAKAPLDTSLEILEEQDRAFDCAISSINQMGFEVTTADRDAGLIRAIQRQTSNQALTTALTGGVYQYTLNVSFYQDAARHSTKMRITANALHQRTEGLGAGGTQSVGLSEEDRTNILRWLRPCASFLP